MYVGRFVALLAFKESSYSVFFKKVWQTGGPASRLARLLNTNQGQTPESPDTGNVTKQPSTNTTRYQRRPGQQYPRTNLHSFGGLRNVSKEVIGLQEQMYNDITQNQDTQSAIERFQKFVERAKIEAGADPNGAMPQKYKLSLQIFEIYFEALLQNFGYGEKRIQMMVEGLDLLNDFELQPNPKLLNSLLQLLAIYKRADQALSLLKNQQSRYNAVDYISYEKVIQALMRSSRIMEAKEMLLTVHSLSTLVKPPMIKDFRNLHISLAIKALNTGYYDIAKELIDLVEVKISEWGRGTVSLPSSQLVIPPFLYASLLGPSAEHDRGEIVIKMITHLEHQSIQLNSTAYPLKIDQGTLLTTLNFAAREKDVGIAETTFKLLKQGLERGIFIGKHQEERKSCCKPVPPAFHAMIHTYASVKQWSGLFNIIDELEQNYTDIQYVTPFGTLENVVKIMSADATVTDEAYFELDNRLNNQKVVTPAMLNLVLAACAQGKDRKEAETSDLHPINRTFATFEEFSKFNCVGNVDSYNCLIEVCRHYGKRNVISTILDEMNKNKVDKNRTTYELIFMTLVQAKDFQGVQVVLNDMKRYQLIPSTRFLFAVLEKCVDLGYLDLEREIRKELTLMGVNLVPVLKQELQVQRNKEQQVRQKRERQFRNDQDRGYRQGGQRYPPTRSQSNQKQSGVVGY